MCEHFTASQHFNSKDVNCDQTKLQLKTPQAQPRNNRLNVVQQLSSRQISASNEHFPHSFVTKEPLKKFKLRKIVTELGNGHVFLGFTKNGQFVVSYSLQVEADEVMFSVYNYKLYWWHFVPNRPLKLISEVVLFGEHEIGQDLHILVCQWPSDETKILVYGFYRTAEWIDQQSQQCYITITAIPSLEFCANCSRVEEGKKSRLCLEHSFTIHTQYHIAPPFPEFVPTICLKIDGTVIINTGDSLLALSVHLNVDSKSNNSNLVTMNDGQRVFCNSGGEKSENHKLCSSRENLNSERDEVCKQCEVMVTNQEDEYLFITEADEESAKENISPHNCGVSEADESLKCLKDKAKDGSFSVKLSNSSHLFSCVTCVKRIFVENITPITFDEDEDAGNTGYHNCLPVEVRGSNYEEMPCLPHTRRSLMVKKSIVLEQHTFDVEQFVHEVANRLCSTSGKKYLAVDDYDIQVVDVDPETGDITGLAFILIKATSNNTKNQLKFRYTSNFYQTKLILVWNIYTGENRIELLLYFTEKTASSNAEQHSCCINPHMPRTLHHQLQKVMENVPKPEMKSVKVLSNLPALKGTSLTSIVSPYHHIALVL